MNMKRSPIHPEASARMLNRGTYETTSQHDYATQPEHFRPQPRILPDSPTLRKSTRPQHSGGSDPIHAETETLTMRDRVSESHARFGADALSVATCTGANEDARAAATSETFLRGGRPPWQSGVAIPADSHPRVPPSSYTREYGVFGSNPAAHAPLGPTDINQGAATADLFHGTTKASAHLPNYSGFIPSSKQNEYATHHGSGAITHPVNHTDHLGNQLQNLPGYSGHKPRAVVNDVGGKSPNLNTTYGATFK